VRFRIGLHTGHKAPPDAVARLAERLGGRREEARFSLRGGELEAIWGEDAPSSMSRDERAEIGRSALLEIVGEACERAPGLRLDWFAISPIGY
jgi:hypothetical protein